MTEKTKPDWEAFGKAVMEYWPESAAIDCFAIESLAAKHNILAKAARGYDPVKHGDSKFGEEPGDPYFERNYEN